ncbi:MAG: hypothetical protein R8K20_09740 [Gallionellaceae bacterium]
MCQHGFPRTIKLRKSILDSYLPFVRVTLTKFTSLTASRLHEMCSQRGFVGIPSHFSYLVSQHRPRPAAEEFLRLVILRGEQEQLDWGNFGHI